MDLRPWRLNNDELDRVSRSFIEWESRYEGSRRDPAESALDQMFDPSGDAAVFRTSGSTGESVSRHHSMSDLWEEAKHFASLLSGAPRIVSLVPPHHIYGFIWTVLLPKVLQVPVNDNVPFREGDVAVGAPVHWRYHNRLVSVLPPITVVTSTAPCEPSLLRDLRGKGVRATWEVYGCSEAGGIGMRTNPDDAYNLLPFWRSEGHSLVRNNRVCDPPDVLEWEGSRRFRPLGRVDHAVQVSGVNVYPAQIERKLLGHPKIEACQVRLSAPERGGRLKAFLVAPSEAEAELRAWIDEQLTPPERPRTLSFGPALPVNNLGKAADW